MDSSVMQAYEMLHAHYGELHWWPARTPYEVMVGAILTQNTAWVNVEKAIANFGNDLTPEFVAHADIPALIEIIRPAGFFNQKAQYLKAVTAWFARYDYATLQIQAQSLATLRAELLSCKGVGHETADSILLYGFGLPTFVVDAYTQRLCSRFPIEAGHTYAAVKEHFEENLPKSADVYNKFHALIVNNAKEHCRKKPSCDACPLTDACAKSGIAGW